VTTQEADDADCAIQLLSFFGSDLARGSEPPDDAERTAAPARETPWQEERASLGR
jgi:hypothetical protein